ncbi:MAG: T9SS type A sorting domain-containing protein [Bacteroidetes bacterium]|nr:T9SS type A sorting domain-containing protein [Bacteroidota bacterium]
MNVKVTSLFDAVNGPRYWQAIRRAAGIRGTWLAVLLCIGVTCTAAAQSRWISVAKDARDGANASLPDAKEVWYRYDPVGDSLWFRIDVYGSLNVTAFGINIIAQTNDGSPSIQWWGSNKFVFSRLASVWVSGPPYVGIDGIADVTGVIGQNYTNLGQNNVRVQLDQVGNSYYVGIRRADLTSGSPDSLEFIVAVGSNQSWNDDVPNTGSIRVKDLAPSTVDAGPESRDVSGNLVVAPNPCVSDLHIGFLTARQGRVRLDLYSAAGREATVFNGTLEEGRHDLQLDTRQLVTGAYYLVLTSPDGIRAVRPFVISR